MLVIPKWIFLAYFVSKGAIVALPIHFYVIESQSFKYASLELISNLCQLPV